MPSYLVESDVAGSQRALDDARTRARLTAELGSDVRYLQTTFLPSTKSCSTSFEAPSIEALDEAGRGHTSVERILEPVEAPPSQRMEER